MQGLPYLIIALFFGLGGALVARSKGNPALIWFAIAFLVPVAGLIAAIFSRSAADELRRECPTCGKVLPISDTLCTGCGTDLDYPDEMIISRRDELRRSAR
ncbi:MAG: hypothetical protein NTX07_09700 [Solirubrobacterales bacterium]|nr:hypothetical protein [Solirubrobacterales bacterium]